MLLHDKLKPYRLILASQSPRRQQLLAESGLPYEPAPRYDCQEVYPATLAATQVPRYLSQLKSRAYPRPLAENEILLTADTVVILNGEVTPADKKAEIMKKELQWCKSVLDASDKKWRIVMTHAGPYTSNHDPLDVRDYYINDSEYSLDAMGVDLFLNGHDHIYIRSTVKNDIKVNTGDGTTYLTGGTVGNKFYEYIPARSDYSTDFYTDEEDKQVFSIIEFSEDSIKGTAYQKQDADNWNSFKAVDSYEIRNTLREGKSVTDYTDVPANAWYYKAADYVTKNGLLSGDKAYTFGASKALTRAQVAQALYNLAGQPKTELTDSFSAR